MSAVRPLRRQALVHALWIACAGASMPAFAADDCGAPNGGQVVCNPTTDPLPQVRYEGVTDLEVIFKQGVVVDGRLLPEPDTAVVVYGDGAISLHAEDGTVIRADAWPAVDVVSNSGPVDVRVDQVFGGSLGVAALANGDVNVYANHVEGAIAIQAQSLGGNVSVDVASVLSGAGGAGVFAQTTAGDISILAGEAISQGDWGTGLWASSENGSVSIEAGFIRAEGMGATAIFAETWEGGDVVIDVGTASASGQYAVGILAGAGLGDVAIRADWVSTEGHYGVGIAAFAFNGDVYIDADGVGTQGDQSRAIDVSALGTVGILSDWVFTSGTGADAIHVENVGEVGVDVRLVSTYGNDSYGLSILTGGAVSLDVDEIGTYGERSAALFASSDTGDIVARVGRVDTFATTGDWFAVGLSSNSGDVALQVDEHVRAQSGYAITLGSMTGGAHVVVAEGADVFGQATAIDAATGAGTRVDIAGTVESLDGPVISIAGNDWGDGAADIRVAGSGEVRGFLRLSDGDDVFANAGAFVSSGTSTFGAGNDRFANTGEVSLRDGATSMSLEGLEHFDNAGRVSLVNGRTGDVFAVDGTLNGAQGNAIAVDLDLEDRTSDRIEVGALSGTNALELDLVGRGPLLGMGGIRVLTSQGAQTGNELVLANASRNLGFIGFRLAYDGLDSWTLESDLSDAAYLAAAVPAGVRDVWRQGVQSVSTHLTATHDEVDADGVWFQAIGGDFEGTSQLSHALGSRELEWQGDHQGLQVGAETTIGQWRAGVTGGYGKATMDLGGAEETKIDSLNLGLYAQWTNDGWFANAVLRGDRIDIDSEWNSIGLQAQGDGSAIGLEFEGGHRFALSRAWIEPNLRLAWIDVSLPDQDGASGDVHWEDGAVSTGEIGLRIGTDAWASVRPYASMSIAREFGGEDATFYDLGFDQVRVTDEGDRSFGRFAGGVEWTIGRVDLYGEFEARTGDMEGVGGRLGARMRF